jgi:hypothetical protein
MEMRVWDGRPLAEQFLGLAVTNHAQVATTSPSRVVAVVSDGAKAYTIDGGRVGDFFRAHPRSFFGCLDAGETYLALVGHLRGAGHTLGLEAFHRVISECRLFDVRLYHVLLHEARFDTDPPPPPRLAELAAHYLPEPCATGSGADALTSDPPAGPPPDDDGSPATAAAREASVVLKVLFALCRESMGVEEALREEGMDIQGYLRNERGTNRDFGPFAVGLQTQGRIALTHASRRGLRLHPDATEGLRRVCREVYTRSSCLLDQDREARKCFQWHDGEVRRRKGLPMQQQWPLRKWLERTLGSAPSTFGIPLHPPRTADGEVSILPVFWGDLVMVHPLLRAWSELWAAAEAEAALGGSPREGARVTIRPSYDLFPRLMSRGPDLSKLRRLAADPMFGALNDEPGRGRARSGAAGVRPTVSGPERGAALFEAESGHRLLVGRLPHLVLRCQAQTCEHNGGQSQLGGIFRGGVDPVEWVAKKLYVFTKRSEFVAQNPDHEERDEEDDGAGAMWRFEQEFEETALGAERTTSTWIALAGALLDTIPRGLNGDQFRQLLRTEHRIDLTPGEAERYSGWLLELLPELLYMADEDFTLTLAAKKLGCRDSELADAVSPRDEMTAAPSLRNLVSGRREDRAAFSRLRDVCADASWKEKLAAGEGSPALYRELFEEVVVTPVGRVRRGAFFTTARAAAHLCLADDVVKAVLFALVAAGHDLLGWDGREFAVQVSEREEAGPVIADVKRVAEGAARRVVTRFPPKCEVREVSAW